MHNQTAARLFNDYPVIWKPAKVNPRGSTSGPNLSRYGSRGLIYELAEVGVFGTITETERVKVYEAYNYLSFKRQRDERD